MSSPDPVRARGTTEFQGGPLDGLELLIAHLEQVASTIEVVLLEDGTPLMRRLVDVSEWGARLSGYYRFSSPLEGGDCCYHWQGRGGRPDEIVAVRWR